MVLSLVMFSGASQFAFVGVAAAGVAAVAAVPAALLLGVRNAFYGVPISEFLRPAGLAPAGHGPLRHRRDHGHGGRPAEPRAERYAFWSTGLILFALWQTGSLVGALLGTAIDPARFGLDAAAPAVFLALLWPQLQRAEARWVALGGAVASCPVPVAPTGVPVIAAAGVALAAGWSVRTSAPGGGS